MWQINNFVQFVTSLFYFVLCLENFDLFVRKWASIFLFVSTCYLAWKGFDFIKTLAHLFKILCYIFWSFSTFVSTWSFVNALGLFLHRNLDVLWEHPVVWPFIQLTWNHCHHNQNFLVCIICVTAHCEKVWFCTIFSLPGKLYTAICRALYGKLLWVFWLGIV